MRNLDLLKNKKLCQIKPVLFGLAMLFINFYGLAQNQKVHISGSFPDLPEATFDIFPLNVHTPLKNGKLDIWLDSIEDGAYPINIVYPLKPDSNFYAFTADDGRVKRLKGNPGTALSSYIYLAPNQAQEYILTPVEGMSIDKIEHFKRYDDIRSDLFSLNVISKSEDTRIYQKLQKIKENHDNISYYKIMDSLYKNSSAQIKFYGDYDMQARKLNYQNNYASLLKAERDFALKYPESPIAVLAILDIDSAHLAENQNVYKQIMGKFSGRAVESGYYKSMELRIQSLSGEQLKEGTIFAIPSGKTPEQKELVYNPATYKYTLVEFWASWCGPCRAQNPNWNNLLNKYRDKGFQILGVSLDQFPKEWKDAIAKDSLNNWLHISDLQYPWTSANASRYGIRAIPLNVLIDAQGRIVKKDINPQELDEFLGKLLKAG